ncbi:ADP-ribose pyrophosphatase [Thermodesulfobium acidiphilum]|uniref:GDP-mannose pyrophosphatase n=1 Tax=Thermodesulfobium acidiphilum TaxID=1794699 RepID=A0A2R4VZQ8_THEAF|nr:NUDIX hydrolase [Thermodesulfobium acidiphilum]AWB10041.1 ADP-ribose pyrophosphatase [Thermodesulfobium acidiphilum]
MKEKEDKTYIEYVYSGKIIKVRREWIKIKKGSKQHRTWMEVVEFSNAVGIIALPNKEEILLVEQFRYAPHEKLLEIPAGKLNPGESPEDGAVRELIEETGYRAKSVKRIFSMYTTPGFTDEYMHIMVCEDLEYVGADPDEDELINVVKFNIKELEKMVLEGKIKDAKTVLAVLYLTRRQ